MYYINQYLENFDIFGNPINLIFKNNNVYRTGMGGLWSLSLIILIFFFFFGNITEFIYKKNVESTEEKTVNPEPDEILLTNSKFMFAIRII